MSLSLSPKHTSSPALAAGRSRRGWRVGRTTGRSGPAVVPANLSPRQAKAAGLLTTAICGPRSTGSSSSAVLQSLLENRLRALLDVNGSPEYALTWKHWDMPAGGSDLCAAGVGAPHARQRLWWVADHDGEGWGEQLGSELLDGERSPSRDYADGRGAVRGVADAQLSERRPKRGARPRVEREHPVQQGREENPDGHAVRGEAGGVGDAGSAGGWRDAGTVSGSQAQGGGCGQEPRGEPDEPVAAGADGGLGDPERHGLRTSRRPSANEPHKSGDGALFKPWTNAIWTPCADGKARRIEPGIEPLVDGFPGRVDQVRAYGNSIVPEEAAEVLRAIR